MERRKLPGFTKRAPVVNGIFYPDNREVLIRQLKSWGLKEGSTGYWKQSLETRFPAASAILAPHGAWDLSGSVAGTAFAEIQKDPSTIIDRVLLLGTIHNRTEEGIYLSESAFFETPLGDLPVDGKLNEELASCSPNIKIYDIPHLSEHSLEVLLPMVKYCFPSARIVPLLMAGSKSSLISCLAKTLGLVLEKYMEKSLFVISSNVSCNPDPVLALSLAQEFCSLVTDRDVRNYLGRLAAGHISACGGALVGALFESGLLGSKLFSALCPLTQAREENGETVYYCAFNAQLSEYT